MAPKFSEKTKRNRKLLNLQEKYELIKLREQGMSVSDIGRKLGVPRPTVSTIVKDKAKVLEGIKNALPVHTKVIRNRESVIADMEKHLNVWIQDQASHNIPLSQVIIQAKARSLFDTMKSERGHTSPEETFQASRGWFARFKIRSNLHNMKVQGEADTAAAEIYPAELGQIVEDGGYTKQQIFNVDETALYWKKMPARTFIPKEKSMSEFKEAEDQLKPMLVFQSENPRSFGNEVEKYAVIMFQHPNGEEEIEVVPLAWISGSYCFWPPYISAAKISRAKTLHEKPEKNWHKHSIRILGIYETLTDAKEHAKTADDVSDLNSNSEGDIPEDIVTDYVLSDCLQPLNSSSAFIETIGKLSPHNSDDSLPTDDCPLDNKDFQDFVTRSLSYISVTLQEHGEILKQIRNQKQIPSEPGLLAFEFPYNFPLQTVQEFDNIDDQCGKDLCFRNYLVSALASVGGRDCREATFRMMRKLLTSDVAAIFSFFGAKKKRPFNASSIAAVILDAVRKNACTKTATEKEVETAIMSWLRHAPARKKMSKATCQ